MQRQLPEQHQPQVTVAEYQELLELHTEIHESMLELELASALGLMSAEDAFAHSLILAMAHDKLEHHVVHHAGAAKDRLDAEKYAAKNAGLLNDVEENAASMELKHVDTKVTTLASAGFFKSPVASRSNSSTELSSTEEINWSQSWDLSSDDNSNDSRPSTPKM